MEIKDLLKKDLMIMDLKASTKMEAIDEMVAKLKEKNIISDEAVFKDLILKREERSSTGLGEGIAMPHAKTSVVNTPSVLFARSNKGIDYDALDDEPVYIFFMIAASEGAHDLHIETLAKLSKMLLNDDFTQGLKTCESPDEVYALVDKYSEKSEETEINCPGPKISEKEKEEFLDKIRKIKSDDFVILSGSVPSNLGNDFYINIIEILNENSVKFTLDSSGETFKKSLKYKPFLIKPNKDELKQYAKREFKDNKEIIDYVRTNLVGMAENVIISLGGEGALYIAKDFSLFAQPFKAKESVVNTVGAGDSVVAGFVNYMLKENDVEKAFRFAVACGTATSFSEDIGELEFIEEISKKLVIEREHYGN